jgi:TPR repeat protein
MQNQIRIFILMGIFCIPLSGKGQFIQQKPGELTRKTEEEAALEKKAATNWLEAIRLYFSDSSDRAREEAISLWREVASIPPKENLPALNHFIIQSALNSGEFKAARNAMVASGQLRANSVAFQSDRLESIAWRNPKADLVVRIDEYLGPNSTTPKGSGTIISEDGWILTAAHVVARTKNPFAFFSDGNGVPVTHVYPGAFRADLALIKVDRKSPSFASLSDSEIQVGDQIYSASFPAGCWIPVKSNGKILQSTNVLGQDLQSTTLASFPGSSGGGVFNTKGELIGVNTLAVMSEDSKITTTAFIVSKKEIQNLLKTFKENESFPIASKEEWGKKSSFWSNNSSAEALFSEASVLFPRDQKIGLDLMQKAYEKGSMSAAYFLGCYLLEKTTRTREDEKKAYKLLKEASQTHITSLAVVGYLEINGIGTEKNIEEGIQNLKEAAEKGSVYGNLTLGTVFLYGFGVPINEKESVKWLETAAEKGDNTAQFTLGNLYLYGMGVSKTDKKAFEWFSMAAKNGHSDGKYNLACCFIQGIGTTKDTKEGFRLLLEAAKDSNIHAEYNIGLCYSDGIGVAQDRGEAFKWFAKAAERGSSGAQYMLGAYYFGGLGVAKDEKEAVKWFRKSAEQGFAAAQHDLGYCLFNGVGVGENKKEAIRWYQLAADQGAPNAQINLGLCFSKGIGVEKDEVRAFQLFKKAADQGNPLAQYNLANSYSKGSGTVLDEQEAAKWYIKAADQGHPESQFKVGLCYLNGIWVSKDIEKAIKYLAEAEKNGIKESVEFLAAAKAEALSKN